MATNILITGVSGYIGGTLLKYLLLSSLTSKLKVFALVRSEEQAMAVGEVSSDATPLVGDGKDGKALKALIVEHSISVVVENISSRDGSVSVPMIEGLAEVQRAIGCQTHFIHTSGAKYFSSHTGLDGVTLVSDLDDVYKLQKNQTSTVDVMQKALPVNTTLIDLADSLNVKSYTVFPPMVYGLGEGFGNKLSIQIVEAFKLVRKFRKVYQLDPTETSWVLCHVLDLTALYVKLLERVLREDSPPPSGKLGFYFAENGRFSWNELNQGIARSLGLDTTVKVADETDLMQIAKQLKCPPSYVNVACAGSCNIQGDNGRQLGWVPKYGRDHLLSEAGVGAEVKAMLELVKEDEAARGSGLTLK